MTTTEINVNRMAWVPMKEGGFAVDDVSHWKIEAVQRRGEDPLVATSKDMVVIYFKSGGLMYIDIKHEEFVKALSNKPFTQ